MGTVTTCQELGIVKGVFDGASATISIPVPVALISALPCAVISPGIGLFGGSLSATPSAFFTSSAMPLDTLDMDDVSVNAC